LAIEDLKAIFTAAVERVSPYQMIKKYLALNNHQLEIQTEKNLTIDLNKFDRVLVLGAGKATASMARAIEELLGPRIVEGLISVKYGHTVPLERIDTIEAGHPVPDENSVRAADEIRRLAELADAETLVFNLISGGGSALLSAPYRGDEAALSLSDKQQTTQALLACGASIGEINCIRKHISSVKGGRLARTLYPATSLNLMLSDVVGDRLDTIASGLTVPDLSTYKQAAQIITKYKLSLPTAVEDLIEKGSAGLVPETPKAGDMVFTRVHNILLGTNYTGLLAAAQKARDLGYNTVVLSSRITGEAREAAKFYSAIARDVSRRSILVEKPACIIAGGETTVTLRGEGKGGRNQECALSFLLDMQEDWPVQEKIYFLSASTDGNDGPTDAAGAFVYRELLDRAQRSALSPGDYLERNDSYHFFERLDALLKTGPTNTNVCDYQICLVL